MDSLYLLLPMTVLLVLALIGLFAWAIDGGQFDDLEREGARLLDDDEPAPANPAAIADATATATSAALATAAKEA
jgi:cbb3-type cytochrome oxidase maturation protein